MPSQSSEADNTTLTVLLTASILLIIVLAVALVIVWKNRQAEVVDVTRNDVYGTYENGVEYSTATDTNNYYAAPEELQGEGSRTADRNSMYVASSNSC